MIEDRFNGATTTSRTVFTIDSLDDVPDALERVNEFIRENLPVIYGSSIAMIEMESTEDSNTGFLGMRIGVAPKKRHS